MVHYAVVGTGDVWRPSVQVQLSPARQVRSLPAPTRSVTSKASSIASAPPTRAPPQRIQLSREQSGLREHVTSLLFAASDTASNLSSLQRSLFDLLKGYKARRPEVMTKSGLMLGVGETDEQVIEVMRDLRAHDVDMLTLGQYMQPSRNHLPVDRWVPPSTFDWFAEQGRAMGFTHVASGPLVRSSYHADQQAHGIEVK